MNVTDYIDSLERARDQMIDDGFMAHIRGDDPPTIGSFLYVTSSCGAVEISIDGTAWFVECWDAENDATAKRHMTDTLPLALELARAWLTGDAGS